ncbi:MAG: hypothetical protein GY945_03165 [Rhodobacteraceae bacterium]|nr:hypothetical protein [Paracoccaceae bacterium]
MKLLTTRLGHLKAVTDGLDPVVAILRNDIEMKTAVQEMLLEFIANAET